MFIEMIDYSSVFTKEQLDYIVHNVAETAKKICGAKLRGVILYGSYARGDFQPGSDVDIMVLVDGSEAECKHADMELFDALYDLDHQINLRLSVVVTPYSQFDNWKQSYPFYRNTDIEGVRYA